MAGQAVDLHGRGLGEDDISVRCLVNEATADAGDGDLPSGEQTLGLWFFCVLGA